jgi:signal transduction histidine kinase
MALREVDGSGGPGSPVGNGIMGLAERAQAAGATLRIGRAPEGGYLLRVAR